MLSYTTRLAVLTLVPALWAQTPFHSNNTHKVATRYAGAGLNGKPLALASADFDQDGVPDLVSGFATGGAGAVSIHRGNIAGFPEFLPDARVVSIPEPPDFIGTGDFDADGYSDIVTARLGGKFLYLLRGDGHGGFAAPEKIELPGTITAFTTGEINRADGLTDIAVAVTSGNISQVLVFESPLGALRGKPEILAVASAVSSLAVMAFDGEFINGIAAAAGNDLFFYHGRDRKLSADRKTRDMVPPAAVTHQRFSFQIRALVTGRFTSRLADLAALGDDGKVHFLERPDADYQAAIAANARVAGADGRHARFSSNATAIPPKPTTHDLIERREIAVPGAIAPRLVTARTSLGQGDDVLALDNESGRIHFLSRSSTTSIESGAVAVTPMRLGHGAIDSLVVLNARDVEPSVIAHDAPTVFTVTNTADSGPGSSSLFSTVTPGSLRTAITNAANAGGLTSIVFAIPTSDPNYNTTTGVFTIKPLPATNCGGSGPLFVVCQALPPVPADCTLDGYTQSGASPNTLASGDNAILKIEISGALAGQGPVGLSLLNGGDTVRGIIFSGFQAALDPSNNLEGGAGVSIQSGNNLIEGNFFGLDSTGAVSNANESGILDSGSSNIIGGTTPGARNLFAGNPFAAYASAVSATVGTELFEGNYVGTDRTGTVARGGGGVGINGSGSIVGGTTAGAGNLIAGSSGVHLAFESGNAVEPNNNLVQGNLIGVDVTGAVKLANSLGVSISGGNMNLIGGTTPAARNIISGNAGDGIVVFNASDQNTIQGNYVGVDVSGAIKLGNSGDGMNLTLLNAEPNGVLTLIGGEVAGAGNVISNSGRNGIEIGGQTRDAFGNNGTTVLGNLIGTDPTSVIAMGNTGAGILIDQGAANETIGSTDTLAANTIAFNGGAGVEIDPATGNVYSGLVLGASSVAGNLIFSNGGAGVRVVSGVNNTISQNSIFSNGALGIDIDAAGPLTQSTCNSNRSGANDLQNAPVLTPAAGSMLVSATATDPNGNTSEFSNCAAMASSGSNLNIAGTLNSTANTTFQIQFFANQSCDASGFGQGKTFLNSISVTTNSSCAASFGDLVNPNTADLNITVTPTSGEGTTVILNTPYTFVVRVTNLGGGSAANVVLSDPLPATLTFASATTTQGTCNASGGQLTCTLGAMPSGATATVMLVVSPNAVGSIANTATISSSTTDPNSANNSATLTLASNYNFALIDHFSPATITAGTGVPLSLTIVGLTFYQGVTTVTINGSPISSTFLSNQTCTVNSGDTCQGLVVTIPASMTASTGMLTFVVTNPTPGGGTNSATITIFANAGGATQFLLSGIPNPASQNTAYNLTVTAANASGQTVTSYLGLVNLTSFFGTSTTFSPPSPYQFTVADQGVHVFTATPLVTTFPETLTVSDAGNPSITGSVTFIVSPTLGPPSQIRANNPATSAPIGFPFQPLIAAVTDASGNFLPGISVTFTAPSSGASGTFQNGQATFTAVTDSNGNATANLTANQTVGSFYEVDATVGNLKADWFLSNTNDVPASLTVSVGNNQATPLDTLFRFGVGVIVKDAGGNPLSFIPVNFTAQTSNGATAILSSTTGFSEGPFDLAPGQASVTPPFTNNVAGTYTITASVGTLTATFTETNLNTPNPVASVQIISGGGQSTPVNAPFAPLLVQAFDQNGNALSNVPITFTVPSSGASATLPQSTVNTDPATGVASLTATANGIAGPFTITASAGGFSASTTFTNTASVNNILSATAGTPQTATINTAFAVALQAKLTNSSGTPLSGKTVTFSAPASGASAILSSPTAVTNSSGIASVQATANATADTYAVTASAPALTGSSSNVTATFSLTNAAPTAGSVIATGGASQSTIVNTAFATALQVTVRDTSGTPMSGVAVSFSAPLSGPSATLGSGVAMTNSSGIASLIATANTVAGSYSVTATVGSLSATFGLTNTPGAAASITATAGTPQLVVINTALATAMKATVTDSFSNPISGASVTFAAPSSGASGSFTGSPAVITNSAGVATAPAFTANGTTGPYQVTATSGSLSTTFSLTNAAATPANLTVTAGSPQSATVNAAFATAFKVQVTDSSHNPLSGVGVVFAAPSTGASGSFTGNATVVTDSNGTATAPSFTANTTPGSYNVTATAGSLSATISLTNNAGAASVMSIVSGNNQSAAVGTLFATSLAVKITDQFSNPLSGIAVVFTAPSSGAAGSFSGPATVNTNSAGIATAPSFTANAGVGSYQVAATSGSLSANLSLTNLAGAPAFVTVFSGNNQSVMVGSPYAALSVKVTDASGDPLSGVAVSFTAPAGGAGGAFSGLANASTNASGIATAPAFIANAIAGTFSIRASVTGVATSAAFSETNVPGPPASITATAGSPQSAGINSAFPTALQATVKDSAGNALSGVTVNFSAPGSGAAANLSGSSGITNASGIASVTATANGTGGSYAVTASTAGVSPNATFQLTNVLATITVQTSPVGLPFTVDNVTYNSTQSFTFAIGSQHAISVNSPVNVSSGAQTVFTGWSDGLPISHTITASSIAVTLTASFQTQYQLTTIASPAGTGSVNPASGFFNAGSTVGVHATPNAGSVFNNWTGPVAAPGAPASTVVMTGPISVAANFLNGNATVAPNPLVVQYYLGTDPSTSSMPLSITAANQEAFAIRLATSAQGLITLNSLAGTTPATISVSAAKNINVSPGTYTTQFFVTFADGTQLTEYVDVQVFALPGLVASPASLTFKTGAIASSIRSHASGASLQTQSLFVGATTRNVSVTFAVTYATPQDPQWLKLSATGGPTPQNITVSADPTNLSAGTHTATIIATTTATGVPPLSIAVAFAVGSAGASSKIASLPHFAAQGIWTTGIFVVNTGASPANFAIAFHDDNGAPISLPFSGGATNSLSGTLPGLGSAYYEASDPSAPLISGSGLINADPSIVVQALFRENSSGTHYEAAVPSNSGSKEFEIPFDATTFAATGDPFFTGFAIANLDAGNAAALTCTARDQTGTVIPNAFNASTGPPQLAPLGHWAGYLFPALTGKRGAIDCTSNTSIAATALRFIGSNAFSSLPVIDKPAAGSPATSALPHFAAQNIWTTGIFVVNTGNTSANFSIAFRDDNGNPVAIPFNTGTVNTLTGTLPPLGSAYYETGNPAGALLSGSALITSDPTIVVQALFREASGSRYYEAAVPSNAGSKEFEIPFDATTFAATGDQFYTGFAIANMDTANAATVTCTARDQNGTVIPNTFTAATGPPQIAASGHWAGYLFPALTGTRGTIDCVSTTNIGATALHFIGTNAFSSLPVINK